MEGSLGEMRFFRSLGWTHIAGESLISVSVSVVSSCACFTSGTEGQGDMMVLPAHIPRKNIQRKRQKVARAIPATPLRVRWKAKCLAGAFGAAGGVFLRGGIWN